MNIKNLKKLRKLLYLNRDSLNLNMANYHITADGESSHDIATKANLACGSACCAIGKTKSKWNSYFGLKFCYQDYSYDVLCRKTDFLSGLDINLWSFLFGTSNTNSVDDLIERLDAVIAKDGLKCAELYFSQVDKNRPFL